MDNNEQPKRGERPIFSSKRWQKRDPSQEGEGGSVQLHKSAYPWKAPSRDVQGASNEALLRSVRGLLAETTPARQGLQVAAFLKFNIHESPVLSEVVSIIFDAAVRSPVYCEIYAGMMKSYAEKTGCDKRFHDEIMKKVKESFNTKTISGRGIDDALRESRLAHINFIGYLYLAGIVHYKLMHFRVVDLITSSGEGKVDERLIERAVQLIEKIGRRMEEEEEKRTDCTIQSIFNLLERAKQEVSNRVRSRINDLVDRREEWRRERRAVTGNAPIEEEEQMAERRQLPIRGGGRGRGERGRGGWEGERRGGWEGERRGGMMRQEEASRPAVRPMLMRRDQEERAAPTAPVDTDTTSSTSTTTISSMRNQRGTLDSTGVLAMLTGAAPGPSIRQRDAGHPAVPPSASMQQARPEQRRVEQRRLEKTGSTLPKGQAAAASKEITYLGGKKVMRDACRIVAESGELSEYLINTMMNDFLSDTNRDFRVVAAVGPQTAGKSTILSMMAGNQPLDLFRQYVFRPSSREAVEQSKHQSTKVSIYVSKARNIFIDCQPLSCVSLLDEQIQTGSSRERGGSRMGERLALQAQIENLQILAWTLQVSHTVLVCHDWFIDLDIIKQLRTAELLRGATDEISALTQLPKLAPTRKTNLLFVHTRARPNDFKPANRSERAEILKRLFGGAMRVRLAELPPSVANWDGEYSIARPPFESIYFPLGEMKLREMSTAWQDERAASGGGAGGHPRPNVGPLSPVPRTPQQRAREKEKESNRVKDFIADLSGAVPFDEGIVDLRRVVHLLPRESFTPQGAPLLTEAQWFRFACGAWRDQTFRAAVSLLESTLAARRKPRVKRETDATERMRTMKISEKP